MNAHTEAAKAETVRRNQAFITSEKYQKELDECARLLMPRPGMRFLDVGFGAGAVRKRFAPIVGPENYYGIDIAKEALDLVEPEFRSRCSIADVEDFTHAEKFDGIVMSHVIEHLYRPDKALACLARVLAPGGKLVVLTPNAWFINVHRPTNWLRGYKIDPTTVQFFSRSMMERMILQAGLFPLRNYTFGKSVLGQKERLIALALKVK